MNRDERFRQALDRDIVELDELRKLAWKGVPSKDRSLVWKLLLHYLPARRDRRPEVLAKRHREYREIVQQTQGLTISVETRHQIDIDVPRTSPDVALFRNQEVRDGLRRILHCWALRRPATGYVQGINDLATPFYSVFLEEHTRGPGCHFLVEEALLQQVEADVFWCLATLLDSLQDNYTFNQAGITRQVTRLQELLERCNPVLHGHFRAQGVEFMQFAFRWMNCLLLREFPLHVIVRMWDTYLAEGAFSDFHIYVCAAFLSRWSRQLLEMDFQVPLPMM